MSVMSVAEMARARREQMSDRAKEIKKLSQVEELKERKVRDLSRTPAGQLLKERYEAKFEKTLNEWLNGDPGDAIKAVRAHQALNMIREFLASITPQEEEQSENE